jgi:hypothetical protein
MMIKIMYPYSVIQLFVPVEVLDDDEGVDEEVVVFGVVPVVVDCDKLL